MEDYIERNERNEIRTINARGEHHGYQEFYIEQGCWLKSMFKNGDQIGYSIENEVVSEIIGDEGTQIIFYIR